MLVQWHAAFGMLALEQVYVCKLYCVQHVIQMLRVSCTA